MIARLNGGNAYDGNFDVPEPIFHQIKIEMIRLEKEFPGLTFEESGIHVHDRGHRLVECRAISRRHNTEKIADYLDSFAFYLYAKYRKLDTSRWTIKLLEI